MRAAGNPVQRVRRGVRQKHRQCVSFLSGRQPVRAIFGRACRHPADYSSAHEQNQRGDAADADV